MLNNFSFSDVKSGFLIFLIALPLCLGIAMASSFPPISGIFTAVVGGIVASFLGSARLSIKGPAAGLIVIVLSAVQELGQGDPILGYKKCLAVGVAAAICQIIFSRLGAGKICSLIPPSVIHGMLAAIGVIIAAKQIHILLGTVPKGKTPLDLIAEVPQSIQDVNPELLILGLITLGIIVFLPMLKNPYIKKIPPALLSLLIVLPLGLYWHLDTLHSYMFLGHSYEVGPKFLVTLPTSIISSITFPDFTALATFSGWKYVAMLALIGSLESLLTVMAIDSLDQKKQRSDGDKDLFALGIANLVSAMIGGMPMISEVVRSKANIDNGAQSAWSNFFHGVFLLLAITCLAGFIHEIPLSALAAMLIFTGFRLASPSEFYKTYKIGADQLSFFVVTMFVTLKTDLLIGVFSGLVLKIILHVARGVELQYLFKMPIKVVEQDSSIVLQVKGCAIFTNYLYLRKEIQKALTHQKQVIVDISSVAVVDHTTLIRLHQLVAETRGKLLELRGLSTLQPVSKHALATHTLG